MRDEEGHERVCRVEAVGGLGVDGSSRIESWSDGFIYLHLPEPTFCRVPLNPILGFTIRTSYKVGFSRCR